MNNHTQEMKDKAREEFDEKFVTKISPYEVFDENFVFPKNIKSFIDTLIDRTVREAEENLINDMVGIFSKNAQTYSGMKGEFNAAAIACIKDYVEAKGINLIKHTNEA